MNTLTKTLTMLLVSATVIAPSIDARGRNNGNGGNSESTTRQERPGNMGHGTTTRPNNNRPGNNNGNHNNNNNHNNNSNSNRPGNNNHNWNNGGNHNNNHNSNRPGNNHNWNNGGNHNNNNHNNHGNQHWDNGHNHGYRPSHLPGYCHNGWHRPTPPAHWHASASWRPFGSILGVALGTAFNVALNELVYQGYNVNYYGDNTIYLNDVRMLNQNWPDAVMYYDSFGGLRGSRFMYSTSRHNTNRYDRVYRDLCRSYGRPAQVVNNGNGMEASWWGPAGQFIRLSYEAEYGYNSRPAFFTTLSYGI